MDVERALLNLLHVLAVGDLLIGPVLVLFLLPEDGFDLVVKFVTTVTHKQNLEGLFDGDPALKGLVVHQELNKVEQLARLQSGLQAVLSC
jgi:hypothetical protein